MTVDINFYKLKCTDGKHYILPTYIEGIHEVIRFMKQVIYGKELFNTPYTTISGKQMTTVSSLGEHLKHLSSYSCVFSKDYKVSPLIEFFSEEYRKHPIKDYLSPIHGYDPIGVYLFDDFIATMRKNAMAINLKKRVADWESKPKKNTKRLIKFDSVLFKRFDRVTAVRLVFKYHNATFSPQEIDQIILQDAQQNASDQADLLAGHAMSTPRHIEGRVALEEVQKDRERLFTNLKSKPSLFEHLGGYVWSIEHVRLAGFHLDVTFLFNCAYEQNHENLVQEIGRYWHVITQGRCYFENFNSGKLKGDDSSAFGEINRWDAFKRSKFSNILQYFCKINQVIQVVPYAGCHLFGCGFVHRQPKEHRGNPQTKGVIGSDHQRL